MKALCIVRPHETAFREIDPPTPGDEDVLLRVRRVGYCGSDLSTYRGKNPLITLPRIPNRLTKGVMTGM